MSSINVINQTGETVRIALFKQPVLNPNLGIVAWAVASPGPGGSQSIDVPTSYEVFTRYSSDPANPSRLDCKSASVLFDESTARFSIDADGGSLDQRVVSPVLTQTFNGLTAGEVHVANNFGRGLEVTISLDGRPIYPEQIMWPNAVFMEDVRATFYAAVISEFTYQGQRLVQEAISATQVPVLVDGTLNVSGSRWTGFSLRAA